MKLVSFNLAVGKPVKFAFVVTNRKVSSNKSLRASILKRGVLSPITVIPVSDLDDDVQLVNPFNKCATSHKDMKGGYAIIEGQHRFMELSRLIAEQSKGKVEVNPNLNCLVVSKDEVGNLNEYIIELNSTSKTWKNADYIDNANKQLDEDVLIKTINKFKMHGFSLSTISRFICFNPKSLTKEVLANYTNSKGKIQIKDADPVRAIKLYLALQWLGFSDAFLKKRYLIDFLIHKSKVDGGLNPIMAHLLKSNRTHLSELSLLREKDCDISVEIEKVIETDFQEYVVKEALSIEDIRKKEKTDCFMNYDSEDICEFLECTEDTLKNYHQSLKYKEAS